MMLPPNLQNQKNPLKKRAFNADLKD